MTDFIDRLQEANDRDTRVRAALRRSLTFDPGTYYAAFPHVERWLGQDASPWRRRVHYLVAGLWAMHWKEGRPGPAVPMGEAMARYARQHHSYEQLDNGDSSTERRFITLLDADAEQLPHRLRQTVALLKDEHLDFGALLGDLLRWSAPHRPTQLKWAREFYRSFRPDAATDTPTTTQEETA
jgi:CRISPR system Cascade subunit CasB